MELKHQETEYSAFVRTFEQYFENDEYYIKKSKDNFVLFEYLDKEFDLVTVVPKDSIILPSNIIEVRFSPIESPVKVKMNLFYYYFYNIMLFIKNCWFFISFMYFVNKIDPIFLLLYIGVNSAWSFFN